jgi:hypothetical protein
VYWKNEVMPKTPTGLRAVENEESDLFPPDLLRVEKELFPLGFFTPKKKTNKQAREKVIRFTRRNPEKGGRPLEVEIRIIAGGTYGLPTVADQDKYMALQAIIQRKLRRRESINPVTFKSVEILRELGVTKGGKTNEEVGEWLHRMFVTSVFKIVREQGEKGRGAEENMRPFKRRIAYNDLLEDGTRAVENYVWLDDCLLSSFLENRLINFDLQRYLRLKGTISKALAVHLHVWMYAARESGTFEKLYGHLCQLLGIDNYARVGLSRVMQQLGPHFDELRRLDFISGATVEKARTAADFKVVLKPGTYLANANPAQSLPAQDERPALAAGDEKAGDAELLALLPDVMKRGIPEPRARRLLTLYASAEELRAQLVKVDELYRAQKREIRSAVGYYIRALEEKWQLAPPVEEVRPKVGEPDVNLCPDCGGAGYYYPEGFQKGVMLCKHSKLKPAGK